MKYKSREQGLPIPKRLIGGSMKWTSENETAL